MGWCDGLSLSPSHHVTLSFYFVSGLQPASTSPVSRCPGKRSACRPGPAQPALADHCSLELLIGQNRLSRRPRACRHSDFVAFDAFEYDPNPIGFREDFARFHGGPWARNLPVDAPLHRHTASIETLSLYFVLVMKRRRRTAGNGITIVILSPVLQMRGDFVERCRALHWLSRADRDRVLFESFVSRPRTEARSYTRWPHRGR